MFCVGFGIRWRLSDTLPDFRPCELPHVFEPETHHTCILRWFRNCSGGTMYDIFRNMSVHYKDCILFTMAASSETENREKDSRNIRITYCSLRIVSQRMRRRLCDPLLAKRVDQLLSLRDCMHEISQALCNRVGMLFACRADKSCSHT